MARSTISSNSKELCPIRCAIAEAAISSFECDSTIEDLQNLSKDASGVLELAVEGLNEASSSELRALVFAISLTKDIAMAKAVAIAESRKH